MKAIKNPLVSIIIPVYNGSNYLKEAIDSALAQSYKNIEVIVVNDGSTDGGKTLSIINSYHNVRLVDKENGGVSSALNAAIDIANGDYISWLSHDDLYKKNKILNQIRFLSKHNNPKIIPYCKTGFIKQDGKRIHKLSVQARRTRTITHKNSPFGVSFNGCSLLIPKEAFKNPFNEKIKFIQDTIKWYELLKEGYVFMCSRHTDSLLRIHPETVTHKHPELYENEFTSFYSEVRKDVLFNKNYKALKKSTLSLAIMSKKYPFYKHLINENISLIDKKIHKRSWFFIIKIKVAIIISNFLFN